MAVVLKKALFEALLEVQVLTRKCALYFLYCRPHLKIWSVARVLAVDHVEATILGVGGLGGVQVDAKDERELARDDLGVGRAKLGEKCLCLYVCMFMFRPSC